MKIIDIDTGKVIEELDIPGSNFFTSVKYWKEYKKFCKELGKREDELIYGTFIKGAQAE